jgi:hypothetical protein
MSKAKKQAKEFLMSVSVTPIDTEWGKIYTEKQVINLLSRFYPEYATERQEGEFEPEQNEIKNSLQKHFEKLIENQPELADKPYIVGGKTMTLRQLAEYSDPEFMKMLENDIIGLTVELIARNKEKLPNFFCPDDCNDCEDWRKHGHANFCGRCGKAL